MVEHKVTVQKLKYACPVLNFRYHSIPSDEITLLTVVSVDTKRSVFSKFQCFCDANIQNLIFRKRILCLRIIRIVLN